MRKRNWLPMVEEARPAKGRGGSASAALPGWDSLAEPTNKRPKAHAWSKLAGLSTARYAKWLFGIGIAATLFVGHVHATQQTFEHLHTLRKENLRLHLERDRLRGELDHATGPTQIYSRAAEIGLEESVAYGPTVILPAD